MEKRSSKSIIYKEDCYKTVFYIYEKFPYKNKKDLMEDISGPNADWMEIRKRILKRISSIGFKYRVFIKFEIKEKKRYKYITGKDINRFIKYPRLVNIGLIESRLLFKKGMLINGYKKYETSWNRNLYISTPTKKTSPKVGDAECGYSIAFILKLLGIMGN